MTERSERRERARTVSEEVRTLARSELVEAPDDVSNDLPRAAGLVRDDDLRDLLVFAESAYERQRGPEEPDYWSTNWATDRLRRATARTATDAVRHGNLSQLSYIRGQVEYESDVSGLNAVRRLENWLCMSEEAKLVYMAGHMGEGKTDFLGQAFQVVNHFWTRVEETTPDEVETPTVKFASNTNFSTPEGEPEPSEITDYDQLVEWTKGHDSSDELWYGLDESSTHLTAQSGANAQDVAEVMAPFVKKMRKLGVNMVVIGHDRRDVAPAVRVLCDFVSKPSKKKVRVYRTVKNREPTGHMFDLDRVPQTEWTYDTNDMAEWSWGSALEDAESEVDGTVVDKQDLKRMAAIRAAEMYERVESVSKHDVVDMVSTEQISISREMLDRARNGQYQDVAAV